MGEPREIRLQRHDGEAGGWVLASARPHPALAGLVVRYQGYVEDAPSPLVRRELPTMDVPVIINLGAAWGMLDPQAVDPTLHDSFVAGFHQRHARVRATGRAHCIQVDFTPLGAYRFLGMPMHRLAGLTADLADVLGRDASRLTERLREAPDWSSAFTLLDQVIRERIAGNDASPSAEVQWAWDALLRSGGTVRVQDLTRELGWSRKRLRARFREQVGAGAKLVGQVLRFNRMLELLTAAEGDRGLAALALSCGYADQAHMSREFRRFSGLTLREYRRRLAPDGSGLLEP